MNVNKLGLRIISSALATGLILAPLGSARAGDVAWAGPADAGADAPSEGTQDAPVAEGQDQPAEGEVAPPAEGEAGQPAEGEGGEATQPAEGELAPVEIETPAEPEAEGEGEGEAASEDQEIEVPPPEVEPVGPMKPPEPTWGPKDQYPMNGKGMLITGGVVTGLGAAFIITSVLITRCDFDSALSCKLGDQRDFLVPTAVTTAGLGLLLIGVGVGNHLKYKRWQNWTPETAVVPTMVPGNGGGLAWVGRF